MRKKGKHVNGTLILCYDQTMVFDSIEDILLHTTQNLNSQLDIPIYVKGSIDEYQRAIIKGPRNLLDYIKNLLSTWGIRTNIYDDGDDGIRVERARYIKYKFPNIDWQKVDNEWKNKNEKGIKISSNTDPIILNIPEEKEEYYSGIICISYQQFKKWDDVIKACLKINNIYFNKKRHFDSNSINKYNRVFIRSNDLKLIKEIEDEFRKNGILTIRLHRDIDFIPYRYEYIKNYYGETHVSYLNQKWKLEYLNGWFNKEKWHPMILVK